MCGLSVAEMRVRKGRKVVRKRAVINETKSVPKQKQSVPVEVTKRAHGDGWIEILDELGIEDEDDAEVHPELGETVAAVVEPEDEKATSAAPPPLYSPLRGWCSEFRLGRGSQV